MAERLDVRRMLLRRGWTQDPDLWPVLRKNGALWAAVNNCGDSGLDGRDRKFTIAFNGDVPARVIVATCEAAAGKATHSPSPARTPVTAATEAPGETTEAPAPRERREILRDLTQQAVEGGFYDRPGEAQEGSR